MNRKIKTVLVVSLLWMLTIALSAQEQRPTASDKTPKLVLKNNLLGNTILNLNAGIELKTGRHISLLFPVTYNPFELGGDAKWKHILAQPELRYWFHKPFAGHFLGIHSHAAIYNVSGVGTTWAEERRFQGWLAGGGLSYGYQFYLSPRFNIETTIGAGYAYLEYDVYECGSCGRFKNQDSKHYFGPTKAAVSLIYIIK